MLVAVLLALLFGGGSGMHGLVPDMSKAIKQEVSDKALAKELVDLNRQMLEEEQKFLKSMDETLKETRKLNHDRSIDPGLMRAAFEELETKRTTRRDRVVQDLFEMRSQLSEEEWRRISHHISAE